MASTKKTKSDSTSLKQSKLLFASTKRSSSGQHLETKGKKPLVRTGSAPVAQQRQSKRQRSVAGSTSSDSDAAVEESMPVKRRKADGTSVSKVHEKEAEMEKPRSRLNHNDPRWLGIYSMTKERMGDIPPVHGSNQTRVSHILRVFDLSYEYGPCIGVTRLERWERAEALGLHPPPEVYDILMTREGSEESDIRECVFSSEV